MAASHHDLKNLVAIVDCNGVQINGWVNDIMTVEPWLTSGALSAGRW